MAYRHDLQAPVIIRTSPGGSILEFIHRYDDIRRSKRRVVIDGVCISACTLIVGLVPHDRVCVTPFARLAFHSAWQGDGEYSRVGTELIWQIFPATVRALLRRNGWDGPSEHPDLIYIAGDELYSRC